MGVIFLLQSPLELRSRGRAGLSVDAQGFVVINEADLFQAEPLVLVGILLHGNLVVPANPIDQVVPERGIHSKDGVHQEARHGSPLGFAGDLDAEPLVRRQNERKPGNGLVRFQEVNANVVPQE